MANDGSSAATGASACRISRTGAGTHGYGKDNGERVFFTTLGYNLLRAIR